MSLVIVLAAALVCSVALPCFAADPTTASTNSALRPGISAGEIVARLNQSNQRRAAALHAYEGKRSYTLTYRGFPSGRDAEIEVVSHYQAPGSKRFDVISETGSKMIQSKVFDKLLEVESESAHAENLRETALTPGNYTFTLLGSKPSPYGGCYRLGVEPRRDNKLLYRGEICVNAADFAVETIDAEPAKNPSFWTKTPTSSTAIRRSDSSGFRPSIGPSPVSGWAVPRFSASCTRITNCTDPLSSALKGKGRSISPRPFGKTPL